MEDSKLSSASASMDQLIRIVARLRGADGCPWDKKQTPGSVISYLIEEAYELAEAIGRDNPDDICEELGDVLFQILLISRMYQENSHFQIGDVLKRIADKMIRRHPHVFGSEKLATADDVARNWAKIKKGEKKTHIQNSVLDSVPVNLPALMRAYRISDRAAGTGFDWESTGDVLDKLDEEIAELKAAIKDGGRDQISMEFGDVIFTLANVARFTRIHPETALAGSVKKFENRFKAMEKIIQDSGREPDAVSQIEKDQLWEQVKKGRE